MFLFVWEFPCGCCVSLWRGVLRVDAVCGYGGWADDCLDGALCNWLGHELWK